MITSVLETRIDTAKIVTVIVHLKLIISEKNIFSPTITLWIIVYVCDFLNKFALSKLLSFTVLAANAS